MRASKSYKYILWLIALLPCLAAGEDRIFYIAADPVIWDYVPSVKNLIS